jgi:PTS system nitrogen regulatory IIA component
MMGPWGSSNHDSPLRILDFIRTGGVIPDLTAESKEEALGKLSDKSVEIEPSLVRERVLAVLREREQLGSTGIGGGVAIPHGKLSEISRILIVVARGMGGIPFDAVDNRKVHIVFLLLAPDESATLYLKILARVSRLLKAPGVYERIMNAPDEASIRQVIEEGDDQL